MTAAADVVARTTRLRRRIEDLGLAGNVADLAIDGYTVITDAAPKAFFEELRAAVTTVAERVRHFRRFPTNLLLEGRVFEQAVQIEKLNTLYEHLLGPGFIVSQVSASVKRPTPKAFAIHADMNGYDQPFPGHAAIATPSSAATRSPRPAGVRVSWPGRTICGVIRSVTRAKPRPHLLKPGLDRSSFGTVPCGTATARAACLENASSCT